jgi:hypothetical protein
MISSYFSAFQHGDLEPTFTHMWLLAGAIIGSLIVAGGIALESHWPITRMKRREIVGLTFVFFGVGLEALFTLALFIFDEGISGAQQSTIASQQSEIISLEKETAKARSDAGIAIARASELDIKAASLNKEAEELRAKNITLEAEIAPRSINEAGCADISSAVKSFTGSTVRVATYTLDMDGGSLGWQIADCLWLSHTLNVDKELASILPVGGFGVGVSVSGNNKTLVSAIKESLTKAKVLVVDGNGLFPGNLEKYRPGAPPNPDAIVVVGVKPTILMK